MRAAASAAARLAPGSPCLDKIDDPAQSRNAGLRDSKGGVSQLCCNGNTTKPCFTLANNGRGETLGPPGPSRSLRCRTRRIRSSRTPGCSPSTFCIPSTGKSAIDQVTGLPGTRAPIQLSRPGGVEPSSKPSDTECRIERRGR
jgi:hypothetical protein